MTTGPVALAVGGSVLSGLLLAGCAADPREEIHALVEDVTVEANERDADGVRTAVDDLVVAVDSAVGAGDLSADEGARIRDAALAVQAGADEIDPEVIARREAEADAERARQELEAERRAAEEQRQQEAEAERKAEEEAAKEAEEERKRLEEEQKKDEEEQKKDEEDDG